MLKNRESWLKRTKQASVIFAVGEGHGGDWSGPKWAKEKGLPWAPGLQRRQCLNYLKPVVLPFQTNPYHADRFTCIRQILTWILTLSKNLKRQGAENARQRNSASGATVDFLLLQGSVQPAQTSWFLMSIHGFPQAQEVENEKWLHRESHRIFPDTLSSQGTACES